MAFAVSLGFSHQAFAQRVVVFGDSLADTGNAQIATGGISPNSPLGRYSNGLNWLDFLYGPVTGPGSVAYIAGATAGIIPGTANTSSGTTVLNYGFGGAYTGTGNLINGTPPGTAGRAPGVNDQINLYSALGGRFTSQDTVAVFAGGNNGFATVVPGATQTSITNGAVLAATQEITSIQRLIGLGATNLTVFNLPNIGATPAYLNQGPDAAQGGALFSFAYNSAQSAGLQQLAAAVPGVNIVQIDVARAFEAIAANPAAFGFTDVTSACFFRGGASCAGLAFADGSNPAASVHPTEALWRYVAQLYTLTTNTAPQIAQTIPLDQVGLTNTEIVSNSVFDRLINWTTGAYAHKNGVYAEGLGQYASYDQDGVRPSLNVATGGFRGGYDKQIGDSVVGVSFAALAGTENARGLSSDFASVRGDIYGTATYGNAFISADGGAGEVFLDRIDRATGFGPIVANGSTNAFVASVAGEIGYVQQIGNIQFIPTARLSYFHSDLDSYQELSPVLALAFGDRTTDALLGGVRLRAVTDAALLGPAPSKIFAEVGYEDYLSITNDRIIAYLVDNTARPTSISAGDPTGPGFLFKTGVSNQVADHWYVDVNYGLSVHNEGGQSHTGDVRVKATF